MDFGTSTRIFLTKIIILIVIKIHMMEAECGIFHLVEYVYRDTGVYVTPPDQTKNYRDLKFDTQAPLAHI